MEITHLPAAHLLAALAGLALLLSGSGVEAQEPEPSVAGRSTIALASRVIETTKNNAAVPETLDVATSPGGDDLVLVKFPGPVTATELAALERRARRVYAYLPDGYQPGYGQERGRRQRHPACHRRRADGVVLELRARRRWPRQARRHHARFEHRLR